MSHLANWLKNADTICLKEDFLSDISNLIWRVTVISIFGNTDNNPKRGLFRPSKNPN